jgi:hypothetical protein
MDSLEQNNWLSEIYEFIFIVKFECSSSSYSHSDILENKWLWLKLNDSLKGSNFLTVVIVWVSEE